MLNLGHKLLMMEEGKVFGAGALQWPYLSYDWSYHHKTFIAGASYDTYTTDRFEC